MRFSLLSNQFQEVLKSPDVFVANNIKFQFIHSEKNLIGFIIKKQLGGATQRNKFKRCCRYLFLSRNKTNKTLYLVVTPLKSLKKIEKIDTCFFQFKKHLKHA